MYFYGVSCMGIEIERKFLVTGDEWKTGEKNYYSQGYLNSDKSRTVRVRLAGDSAFLTIKGPTRGATRTEFEYAIPVDDAQHLLTLCEHPLIQKYRYKLSHAGLAWEVDEFLGENAGLVVAEVELDAENQVVSLPAWIGQEVTDDPRYFNSSLVKRPYSSW